ncbi:MAG: FliI/YscN family ATPase [Limimaricola soesokkakensis]|uniref:FliI/YscN family ATPase n=1 Tax=Limimaricola soesokkakensis TaxID=1343159 RepID=UPI0040598017
MDTDQVDLATRALGRLSARSVQGRVVQAGDAALLVSGLIGRARLGSRIEVIRAEGTRLAAEVVHLGETLVRLLPEGGAEGVAVGDPVRVRPDPVFAPHEGWIGRVIDPDGRPLDGWPLLPGPVPRARRAAPPPPQARRGFGPRLDTGLAVFNTLLPLVRGQRLGLFAGSGVGKSTLLADLARGVEADIIVIGLVGERGRELRHFVTEVLGEGMERAVVVAATSDRAASMRRRCAEAATAVAEHFRDAGRQVLLLIDSVTRHAEAHREIAAAAGEPASLRGFPASTPAAIAQLCERAGPGAGEQGDITAVYTVLVAGSDMEEPVADWLRGVLDGHVVLDRGIAERGRFPAVDLLASVSRALPASASGPENAMLAEARRLFGAYARAEPMIQAGLYQAGSDPAVDRALACHAELDAFLARRDAGCAASYAALRRILSPLPGAQP